MSNTNYKVQNNEAVLIYKLQKLGKNPDIIATAKKIAVEKIWMGLV